MKARVLVVSSLALFIAMIAAIGAPSSEFASKDSAWWTLDPLMWPTLFAGIILALVALAASVASVRAGAIACVLASLSTVIEVVVAAGTSDHQALAFYALLAAVAAAPAVVAVKVFGGDSEV